MEKRGFLESSIILLRSRKEILFVVTWSSALSTVIAGNGIPPITESFISSISIALTVISVYIYNDIIDREMDAYSKQPKKKGRPIAHGIVSPSTAMRFVYLTGFLGLSLSLYLGPIFFGVELGYYVLIFLYSYPRVQFKRMYILKTIVSCLLLPVPFIAGGVAIEKTISTNILFLGVSWYIILFLVSPAIADMLDAEEDLAFNIKTIGNTISWKNTLILFNLGIITLWASSVIAYQMFGLNYLVPIISSIACLPLIAYSIKIRNEDGLVASHKLRSIGSVLLMFNPLILAIGSII